jgi:hypothetical protein
MHYTNYTPTRVFKIKQGDHRYAIDSVKFHFASYSLDQMTRLCDTRLLMPFAVSMRTSSQK